jgi:glycosyltransferase involved in cell wall biosynthesis
MKILTVCSSFRVFGAETITLKMLEGFKYAGHQQLAVTSIWTDGDFSRRLQALGIPEEIMPFGVVVANFSPLHFKWTANCLLHLPFLWWKWWRTVRRFKPDVVLCTSSKQALLLLPWLHRMRCFLIEFTHVSSNRNIRWLYRQLVRKVFGFIAVSDFMRDHLQSLGAPNQIIHVIKSAAFFEAELKAIAQKVGTRSIEKNLIRIGIAGQIAPNKGHDWLIAAVRILKSNGIAFNVNVFGDGDSTYISSLRQKVQGSELTEVWHWRGYERNKAKIFNEIDICVVPSCFGDPFPTIAMEAGAYGLPVIASRIGGLPEIVEHGVTGWLVEPNSTEQLAERIRNLIENPRQAAEMGAAGRQRVFENFTVEKMMSSFEKLFEDFLMD